MEWLTWDLGATGRGPARFIRLSALPDPAVAIKSRYFWTYWDNSSHLISDMKERKSRVMNKARMQRTGWNKRLLTSTRGRILALLRIEHRTVNELAAALNLTDNAVRAHLMSLGRDGLIQQHGVRRGKRKPHATYGLSAEAEQIFPKAYGPLLNHLLAAISHRLAPRALRATMYEVG